MSRERDTAFLMRQAVALAVAQEHNGRTHSTKSDAGSPPL
jgi:hypothetical protein